VSESPAKKSPYLVCCFVLNLRYDRPPICSGMLGSERPAKYDPIRQDVNAEA